VLVAELDRDRLLGLVHVPMKKTQFISSLRRQLRASQASARWG
jgi:hypothetical protein